MSSDFCLIAQLFQLRLDLLGTRLAWVDCHLHMLRGRTGLHFLDAGKAAKFITDALLTPSTMHLLLTHHRQLEELDHVCTSFPRWSSGHVCLVSIRQIFPQDWAKTS
jgi:hypothetical protein